MRRRRVEPPTAIPIVPRACRRRPPSALRLSRLPSCAHHGADDFNVSAAPAQIIPERFARLGFGRMSIDLQQRFGRHDHAVEAIAALRGLRVNESLLHGIGMFARAKTFEGYDVAPGATIDRNDARARGLAVDQHRAGAAFAQAAAELRPVQFEIVAQHMEKRGIGSRSDIADPAIDVKADRGCHPANPGALKYPAEDYRLCTNVQAGHPAPQPFARFINNCARQMGFYSAGSGFRPRRRLTALELARKIVRIRMITE